MLRSLRSCRVYRQYFILFTFTNFTVLIPLILLLQRAVTVLQTVPADLYIFFGIFLMRKIVLNYYLIICNIHSRKNKSVLKLKSST